MPADPTPAPEWAVKMALVLKWGARKAALVDDPDPDSLRIAQVAAIVRVLREALSANLDSSNVVPSKVPGWRMVSAEVLSMARTALARADAIAKGE